MHSGQEKFFIFREKKILIDSPRKLAEDRAAFPTSQPQGCRSEEKRIVCGVILMLLKLNKFPEIAHALRQGVVAGFRHGCHRNPACPSIQTLKLITRERHAQIDLRPEMDGLPAEPDRAEDIGFEIVDEQRLQGIDSA
jgi:hypothetical protein